MSLTSVGHHHLRYLMSELYKEAAALLQKLERREGGLKSLAYADSVQHKRSSFALVCETLRFKPLLLELLAAVPECKWPKKLAPQSPQRALLLVSLYDLLFGRGKIQGGGHVKKELMPFANAFKAALVRLKIKAKVASNEALLPKENRKSELLLPRYVRVNTLTISADERDAFLHEFAEIGIRNDDHLNDLLVLPPGTELHDHTLVKQGKLVLQDKASCFPAFVLHGERVDAAGHEGDVIDACAAPGNKTSHAAMLLHQQSSDRRKVFAFDRSAKRLDLLRRRMKLAGAEGLVEPCLQSFLEVDVANSKYQNVRSILLDPSCSGSGMTNRLDHLLDIASSQLKDEDHAAAQENDVPTDGDTDVAARLQSLADFQLEALLKAFSFPQVERVSYSTCSIFQKENEEVVAAALGSKQNVADPRPFVLRKCLPTWPRRGLPVAGLSAEQADALVRADGHEDQTNGFFVAYFERDATAAGTLTLYAPQTKVSTAMNETKASDEDDQDHADDDENETNEPSVVGTKRKPVSDAQKETRKRRKKEKLKRKKQQKSQQTETIRD